MNTVFSGNLRRLRQAKGYTQEQAAERLGVSPQSVSRWECGATLPDVLLLPAIAELYCVTVDDLYREDSTAYKNYASRLMAVYESTRDDLNLEQQEKELSLHPDDPREHQLMLAALCNARQYEQAYRQYLTALGKFPDLPELYLYGAEACRGLGRVSEALELLDRSLGLDPELYDAKYAKAYCYEELGDYSRACESWKALASELEAAGYHFEAEEPRRLAEDCRGKL